MPQEIDDFTTVLPELIDMASCELKVYEGLDRLWRMVERYKMTAPIPIRVVDNKARNNLMNGPLHSYIETTAYAARPAFLSQRRLP
jgi:hypothetical protein